MRRAAQQLLRYSPELTVDTQRNVAELLVSCLEHEGVEFVFGIPGEENIHIVDAFAESSPDPLRPRPPRAGRFLHGRYLRASHGSGRRVHGDPRPRRDQPPPRHGRRHDQQHAARRNLRAGRDSTASTRSPTRASTSSRCSHPSPSGPTPSCPPGPSPRWSATLSSSPRPSGPEPSTWPSQRTSRRETAPEGSFH